MQGANLMMIYYKDFVNVMMYLQYNNKKEMCSN
jgi:hypothetical protein